MRVWGGSAEGGQRGDWEEQEGGGEKGAQGRRLGWAMGGWANKLKTLYAILPPDAVITD